LKIEFLWPIPQKEAVKVAQAMKTIKRDCIFEVKGAVEVIKAVEVMMVDGANEATEVKVHVFI
jgi:hypothetical protein